MGLRELKETAHQQFVRGKFEQCARTYQQILCLAPRDPNMHVRHAEVCRRVGDRQQAIASYRAAAELLLELGCESRARGALRAALELDPRDPLLQADLALLGPHHDGPASHGSFEERDELPLLPPLESGLDPVPPAPRSPRVPRHEELMRTTALPPVHRALPAAPSVPPVGPPVLLPAPGVRSAASGPCPAPVGSRTEKMGTAMVSAAGALPPTLPPRAVTTGPRAPAPLPAQAALPPRAATKGVQPPVTPPPAVHQPMAAMPLPARSATAASLQAASQTPRNILLPPPPPAEALIEAVRDVPVTGAQPAAGSAAPEPSREPGPRLEVRRLSPTALAFRSSPNDSWAVIRSHTPLEMHVVEDLEKLPPMMRDFSPEMVVEATPEAASSMVH